MSAVALMDVDDSVRELFFMYGDEKITCQRLPRKLNGKGVLIKVRPDCRVEVNAPVEADDQEVIQAVKKRGRWIYQKLREFRQQQQHITPRKYISGESHYYLGKQYVLKVLETSAEKQGVKLVRGALEIRLRENSPEKVKGLLHEWYKTRARELFAKRLDALLEKTLWVMHKPSIRLLTMQTQWGSCSPNGNLTLNPLLVRAPRECIDYVILHELCHIAEHNHSERFYRLQNQIMPGWEKYKITLDERFGILQH